VDLGPVTPREPAPVPSKSGAPFKTGGKDEDGGTADEKRYRKFQKKYARKLAASQHQPSQVSYADFGLWGRQQTFSSTDTTGSDGGRPTSDKGTTSEELAPSTEATQEEPHQDIASGKLSEDAWLAVY